MQSEPESDDIAKCTDVPIMEDKITNNFAEVGNCAESVMDESNFIGLLNVFEYLSHNDLIRASQVSKLWYFVASHDLLWKNVTLDCNLTDSRALARKLKKHNTQELNLKYVRFHDAPFKSLAKDRDWIQMFEALKSVTSLKKLLLGMCPLDISSLLSDYVPQLQSVTLSCYCIDFFHISKLSNLNELELKFKKRCFTNSPMVCLAIKNVEMLKDMTNLKSISLRRLLYTADVIYYFPTNLETLVLGCADKLPLDFPVKIMPKLKNLKRLRLEECHNSNLVVAIMRGVPLMEKLTQLELIHFNIKEGFEKVLGQCQNLKKLLIIPYFWDTFFPSNAHQIIINGVVELKDSLDLFALVFSLEFLGAAASVHNKKKSKIRYTGNGNNIPFQTNICFCELGQCKNSVHIDMISLSIVENEILPSYLPQTKLKILKVPYKQTWDVKIT